MTTAWHACGSRAPSVNLQLSGDMLTHIHTSLHDELANGAASAEFFEKTKSGTIIYTRTLAVKKGMDINSDEVMDILSKAVEDTVEVETDSVEVAADFFHQLNPDVSFGQRSETERKLLALGIEPLRYRGHRKIYVNSPDAFKKVFGEEMGNRSPDIFFDCDSCTWHCPAGMTAKI